MEPTVASVGSSATPPAEHAPTVQDDLPAFNPSHCLFCNLSSPSVDGNLAHMRRAHGLFVPDGGRLAVDVETLLRYLHLVIFGYFECLACGTRRASAEAAQQHMLGKGHCRIDVSSEGSEYADFYDSSGETGSDSEGDEREAEEGEADDATTEGKKAAGRGDGPPRTVDDSSLLLPSGKLLSHRSAARPARHRRLQDASQGDGGVGAAAASASPPGRAGGPRPVGPAPAGPGPGSKTALTKAERREAAFGTALSRLGAADRAALQHLPAFEQRAVLATQQRQADRARRAERRYRGRLEGAGNSTLMKHFVNDVPGRSLG